MESLKEKLYNYSSDDFGHNTTPELDEVIDKVEKDVKEAIERDNQYLDNLFSEIVLITNNQLINSKILDYIRKRFENFGDY